ncbi:TlpA disulfide reductase family protein [Pedobacter deserti]|uniref:TlpA disulfide reductase family protein n=1 Tax=Pedobacter deserti TaxID=2817382 RepID=UPI00210B611B|nr:TlpA disulfide reductase family protein [Pedobacter sp. SYSU D00382]
MKKILLGALFVLQLSFAIAQRPQANPRLTQLSNEQDSVALEKKLAALYSSDDESDLILLSSYYSVKGSRDKAAEVSSLILKKHPQGLTAFQELFTQIYNEPDPNEKEKLFKNMTSRWSSTPPGFTGLGLDGSRYYVAVSFLGRNRPEKVMEYLNAIKDSTYKTKAFSYAAREAIDARDYKLGEQLIRKTFADLARRGEVKPSGYEEYIRIFSLLLYHNGKYEEGFRYAKELYEYPTENVYAKNEYQNIYMNYLIGMNRLKEAYPLMEQQMRDGRGTEALRSKFKPAYMAYKGSDAGFDEMQTQFDVALKERIKSNISKRMKSEPAFNFTMKDLNGKTVRLSDYRGKVVILDFWATWCGPCKASFPMMQTAVDKFRSDKEVVFLFIHTFEKTPEAPKMAAEYIKSKNYTFNVLMDMRDPETNLNPGAKGFKVIAIPSKFVIDKSGNIRFSSTGGGAEGEQAFLQEMSTMIELAKNG